MIKTVATRDDSKETDEKLNSFGLLVADHVTAMLAYWDKNQVCRFANNAYREWFGKTKEEMVNKITMKELLGPIYEKNLPYILGALKGEIQTFEREIPLPKGGSRHSIANYFPDIENGEVKGFMVHVADVTSLKKLEFELKENEKKLVELNRFKDKFVSTIVHDLKSYFTINYSTIEYLLSDYNDLTKDEILNYLQRLEKNNSNSIYFLDELSEWTRNVLNRIVYNPEKLEIEKEIENVMQFLFKLLQDKKISVRTFYDNDARYAFADLSMFRSVIRNLLTNAIKFSPAGREIVIKTEVSDKVIVITVQDNGIGINDNLKEKILSGANYESSYGTNGEKGIGVGLTLTKEFVEKNNGIMWIDSPPGKGTTFYFTVPANSPR